MEEKDVWKLQFWPGLVLVYTIHMEDLPKERPLEASYSKEDAKLIHNNRFTVAASVLFILITIIVGVLVSIRFDMQNQAIVDILNTKAKPFVSPTPAE